MELVDLHDINERLEAKGLEDKGNRADGGVEHEKPQHDAGGPGQSAGNVVGKPHSAGQPAVANRVDEEGKQHDQHHQAGQPHEQVEADMLQRREEAVVVEHLHEIGEADEGAALGEGEIDRIGRRQDAEYK